LWCYSVYIVVHIPFLAFYFCFAYILYLEYYKKGVNFQWTLDCEKSFQHLKQLLTSAPILRIADPNEDFIVCTYACKEGLGGVLSQNGFVICYGSRKLKEHEKHYATHDLELAAIVHAVITEISSAHGDKNSASSNSNEVIHGTGLISQHCKRVKNYTK
jgi:hypothetical protein